MRHHCFNHWCKKHHVEPCSGLVLWLTRMKTYLGNCYGLLEVSPSRNSESPGGRANQVHCKWHHVTTGCCPMLSGVLREERRSVKRGRWRESQSSLIWHQAEMPQMYLIVSTSLSHWLLLKGKLPSPALQKPFHPIPHDCNSNPPTL